MRLQFRVIQSWRDVESNEHAQELLQRALLHEQTLAVLCENDHVRAKAMGRKPASTQTELISALESGIVVNFGPEWNSQLRCADAARRAHREKQPDVIQTTELVRCDCGHSVARISVMGTSTGTSCPDCYDKMSL